MTITRALNSSIDQPLPKVRFSDLTLDSMPGEYRIAIISDVHLGHDRVRTKTVIATLERTFPDERLAHLDKIIVSGDLFDQRLPYDSEEAHLITRWMGKLLRKCRQYGVGLDILEGTPSHDNRQSRWFVALNEMLDLGVNLRYFDTLTITDLYPNGPSVLFVPDEVNHDADKTWKQVLELMRQVGVDQVDFAVMHGMFTYQEPIRTVVSHSEERYESIVKQRIYIGHHHTHTQLGKVRVPSSLERLRHNEEEDKGHIQVSLVDGNVVDEVFVINDRATWFKTVDVIGLAYPKVLEVIDELNAPDGSFLRLKLSRQCPAYKSYREIRHLYPNFTWSTKNVDIEQHIPESGELIDRPVITSIRHDTLPGMVKERLHNVSAPVMAAIEQILADC